MKTRPKWTLTLSPCCFPARRRQSKTPPLANPGFPLFPGGRDFLDKKGGRGAGRQPGGGTPGGGRWATPNTSLHPRECREDARRLSKIPASWADGERTQLKTSPWGEYRFPRSTKVEHPRKPSCSWTHKINRDEAQWLTDTAHSSQWRLDAEMLRERGSGKELGGAALTAAAGAAPVTLAAKHAELNKIFLFFFFL